MLYAGRFGDESMAGYLIKHMIEKGNPGFKTGLTSTIQINGNTDLSFQRISGDGSNAIWAWD